MINYLTTSDGTALAYRLDGAADRPPLVLSNSVATTFRMWDNVVDALAQDFRVIRYDARGHGASSVPAGDYPLARLGQDVVELLDELRIDRSHFLGLSLGGIVGQWLGVHAAHRVDHLILSNTVSYLGPPEVWADSINAARQAPDLSAVAEFLLGSWFPAEQLATDELVDAIRQMVLTTNRHGLIGSWTAIRDTDLREAVREITSPTLVIAGRHDRATPFAFGETLARTIPGAEFLALDTMHLANLQAPEAFVSAVRRFLRPA